MPYGESGALNEMQRAFRAEGETEKVLDEPGGKVVCSYRH